MSKYNTNFYFFNTAILAAAVYLLFHYLPGPDSHIWLIVVLFSAAVLSTTFLKPGVPNEECFSFEQALVVTCAFTYGFTVLWITAIASLIYNVIKKSSLFDAGYTLSAAVLSVWGAAAVYDTAGGKFGHLDIVHDYIPVLGFLSAYLILTYGFKAIYNSLLWDHELEILRLLKDESDITFLVLVDGVIATILYQAVGIIGLAIVMLLTAGIWKSLRVCSHSEEKYVKTVETFLTVTENKIPHFRGHSERVAKFCQIILSRMRVGREERGVIEYAALLHDIGKLGMPEKLLRIHSYLTSEEVQTLETHPDIGRKLVQQISGLDKVADLIYSHHEKYNGEGYPRKIAGDEIPFGARVIAVANMFDNLVFRMGLRFQQACAELKNMAGAELDPQIVEVLIKAMLEDSQAFSVSESGHITDHLEEGTKDIVEQLRYYLDKSWVLGTLHMSYIVLWEDEELKNLGKGLIPDSIKKYLADYVGKGLEIGTCYKEFIIDAASAKIFNAYFMPVSAVSCLITVFDMTEVLKTERDREDRELRIYRDVISAVTQGKLLLIFGDEINSYINEGVIPGQLKLTEPADVAKARTIVREIAETLPLTNNRKAQLVLCVSEAATNVIKHVGEGQVAVCVLDNAIRVVIQDNGPGIDISQLPQVTLRKGYSTKLSLGFGFTIMLDYLDRLIMSTKDGTVLVLEMAFNSENVQNKAPGRREVAENAS